MVGFPEVTIVPALSEYQSDSRAGNDCFQYLDSAGRDSGRDIRTRPDWVVACEGRVAGVVANLYFVST